MGFVDPQGEKTVGELSECEDWKTVVGVLLFEPHYVDIGVGLGQPLMVNVPQW